MTGPAQRSFLDRPPARLVALAVLITCLCSLIYMHRDDLFTGPEANGLDQGDPATACIKARFADIDKMVTDALIDVGAAEGFKSRAEAICRNTVGGQTRKALPPPGGISIE